jgi:hypothetical protein
MSMPKGITAWEKEPRRLMRSFVIRVFLVGFGLGMGIGEIRFSHFHIVWAEMQIPANRWWGVGGCLLTSGLMALAARDYWRKIQ